MTEKADKPTRVPDWTVGAVVSALELEHARVDIVAEVRRRLRTEAGAAIVSVLADGKPRVVTIAEFTREADPEQPFWFWNDTEVLLWVWIDDPPAPI